MKAAVYHGPCGLRAEEVPVCDVTPPLLTGYEISGVVAAEGAMTMYFGLAAPGESFPIKPDAIFKKELHVTSSYINPYTFERAAQVLENVWI